VVELDASRALRNTVADIVQHLRDSVRRTTALSTVDHDDSATAHTRRLVHRLQGVCTSEIAQTALQTDRQCSAG
jgi:hypothetical protein